MRTGIRGLVGCALMFVATGMLRAEQITSTCRITAVDAAAHTVTLVRKTASGEKTGVAKVAEAVKVTVDGQVGSLASLAPPVDVTVVFDTSANAVVEIRVGKSMATTGAAPPLAIAPFDAAKATEHQAAWAKYLGAPVEVTNSIGMKLVLLPPGEFLMGSPEIEEFRGTDELQHRVRITNPFCLGVYEVTQAEYRRVTGTNPSHFSANGSGQDKVRGLDTSHFPVEQVSWEEAVAFLGKLSSLPEEKAAGRAYRLATEAEWEYACRAGANTRYYFGDDEAPLSDYGWFNNAAGVTHPVGEKRPNAWGLYDMHGNVWEWCNDGYNENYYKDSPIRDPPGPPLASLRGRRGGGWGSLAGYCRAAHRGRSSPSYRDYFLGFRGALVLPGR